MKRLGFTVTILCLLMGCQTKKTGPAEIQATHSEQIIKSIGEWDKAWDTKDVELAIRYYADETDWTNAFGDRVQSKQELKELLDFIFGLDFVMAGENNSGQIEIVHLNDSIATVRSKNIRKGQEWPDGTKMDDRHINHLRVYKNINGEWLIVNHMISQAWPKRGVEDTLQ